MDLSRVAGAVIELGSRLNRLRSSRDIQLRIMEAIFDMIRATEALHKKSLSGNGPHCSGGL